MAIASEWQFRIILPRAGASRLPHHAGRLVMKAIHWIIAAAALSFLQPAQAATTDPEVIIYRFPGVKDDGGSGLNGVATVFHCTNFSGATENIRFVTRTFDATIKNNDVAAVDH